MMNDSAEISQLHRVAYQYKALRMGTLSLVVLVTFLFLYLSMIMLHWPRHKPMLASRLLLYNLLTADALVLMSPMSAQFISEHEDDMKIPVVGKVLKVLQTYSLSLSAYMLVSLALDCYQRVAKRADDKKNPSVMHVAAPHAMALWVTVTLFCASGDGDSIYLSLAQYPFPFCKPFVLLFVYALPALLVAGLLARLAAHPRHNTAQMASFMCMWFLLTNTPFLLAQAAGLAGANVAPLLEILSVVNRTFDPYVFIMYHYEEGCSGDQDVEGLSPDCPEDERRGRACY